RVRETRGPHVRRCRERAEQAVALEALDCHRQHLPADLRGGKHMGRLQMGGPTIWPGLRAGRSNSTSTVVPITALLKADCWLSINSWSRSKRWSISTKDTVSRMSAAGVPGRAEYLNE